MHSQFETSGISGKFTSLPLRYLLKYPQWQQLSDALYDFGFPTDQNKAGVLANVSQRFWHFYNVLKSFEDYSWTVQKCIDTKLVPTELTQIKLVHDAMMDLELLLVPGQIPSPLIDNQGQTGLYFCLSGSLSICQYMDENVEISQHYAISKLRRVRSMELQPREVFPIERHWGNIHELQANADCSILLRIRLQCEALPRYWMFPITPKRLDQDDFFVRRVLRSD